MHAWSAFHARDVRYSQVPKTGHIFLRGKPCRSELYSELMSHKSLFMSEFSSLSKTNSIDIAQTVLFQGLFNLGHLRFLFFIQTVRVAGRFCHFFVRNKLGRIM